MGLVDLLWWKIWPAGFRVTAGDSAGDGQAHSVPESIIASFSLFDFFLFLVFGTGRTGGEWRELCINLCSSYRFIGKREFLELLWQRVSAFSDTRKLENAETYGLLLKSSVPVEKNGFLKELKRGSCWSVSV
ncbi:hypothetical protein HAX54_046991 [Datura stramonium]|uniref:Uncharacterized protein n=1 Tax=Datura stramonium TaxID=4076 RepID=A0ABS8RQK4_DATST|nr:hypothetical protein [Datura stramonium]